MYKSYTANWNQIRNISDNERGFRFALALGMMTAVVAGAIVSPVAIAALSKFAIYLGITAIIAVDPVYLLAEWVKRQFDHSNHGAGTAHA